MKYKHYVIAALLGGVLASPASVYADQRPEELIRNSAQTLEQLKTNKVVPPATLSRAKCVGVFPQVNEAALNEQATLGKAMADFSKPASIAEEQLIGAISAANMPQG